MDHTLGEHFRDIENIEERMREENHVCLKEKLQRKMRTRRNGQKEGALKFKAKKESGVRKKSISKPKTLRA